VGDIIIEETNYKAFALTMASLFMLLASLAIMITGFVKAKPYFSVPGLLGTLVFLIGLVISIFKASRIRKLLTITMDGIIDHSNIPQIGFISYGDIKEFQIVTFYNATAIAVIPKNMDHFLFKLAAGKRRQVKRNLSMNLPPISINIAMAKDMEPEDILSLLQKRLHDYNCLYEPCTKCIMKK